MKKFNFRLESALRLRAFHKQQAARALAQATSQRSGIEDKLRISEERLSSAEALSVTPRGGRTTADEMVRRQAAIAYFRDEVRDIGAQYREALELEDRRHHALMLARQEEEGLLRMKEKAKEAYQVELIRSDELAVQEFTNAQRRSALL